LKAGEFKNGRYVPVDTSDLDALEDFKFGLGFFAVGAVFVVAVIVLLASLLR